LTAMDVTQLQSLLDELFDRQLMFHGFTNHMRDYELVIFESVDPRSGFLPRHRRFLFRFCTEASVRSNVSAATWGSSTSDELLANSHVTMEETGYVWGVRGQEIYPGASIIPDSSRSSNWEHASGLKCWEVLIEANAHIITLVFSDLSVEDVTAGYSPYVVAENGEAEIYASGSKNPLPPDS
jgi:hypothetical protein